MSPIAHNQVSIPNFMYGTAWKKDDTARLVELAVDSGFTAIDTANQKIHYQEVLVGDALLNLKKKGIKRESLFIQTKFTPMNGQGGQQPYDSSASLTEQVNQSMASSLEHLHTDVVDSYVLHGPYTRHGLSDADREVWAAIEALYEKGKTRMIGISNVSAEQLEELCKRAKVKPMVVQNRCYAVTGWDMEVRDICRDHDIVYQGFSLLTANAREMADPAIKAIAKRLNTGVAQVVFRFAMKVGMLPLTGTSNQKHMKEDLAAENLELTDEEVRQIETIAIGAHR